MLRKSKLSSERLGVAQGIFLAEDAARQHAPIPLIPRPVLRIVVFARPRLRAAARLQQDATRNHGERKEAERGRRSDERRTSARAGEERRATARSAHAAA